MRDSVPVRRVVGVIRRFVHRDYSLFTRKLRDTEMLTFSQYLAWKK